MRAITLCPQGVRNSSFWDHVWRPLAVRSQPRRENRIYPNAPQPKHENGACHDSIALNEMITSSWSSELKPW